MESIPTRSSSAGQNNDAAATAVEERQYRQLGAAAL